MRQWIYMQIDLNFYIHFSLNKPFACDNGDVTSEFQTKEKQYGWMIKKKIETDETQKYCFDLFSTYDKTFFLVFYLIWTDFKDLIFYQIVKKIL